MYFLFTVILLVNMLINFDHGVLPAAAMVIKEDLTLTNAQLGWLGSIVFLGLAIGSIAASYIFENCNSKRVLITILIANIAFISLFAFSKIYSLLMISRFAMGSVQVFVSIYYPVWVEAFGTTEK